MKYWNRGAIEKQKIMREVIKENGGVPPMDLREQVIERSKPRLNKIADQFKKDVKEALELAKKTKGSSTFAVGASQAAGTLLNRLPKALAGAGIGAIGGGNLGKFLGPQGALIGAGIGGLAGLAGLHPKF